MLYLVVTALSITACTDTGLGDNETEVPENDYHWTTFYETQEGKIYLGGGYTWDKAAIAERKEDSWEINYTVEAAQILTFAEAENTLYALDFNGYRYVKEAGQWRMDEPVNWYRMHKMIPLDTSFLVVGGERSKTCRIYRVTGKYLEHWELIENDFGFYPMTASFSSEGELVIAGYGEVHTSLDTGKTWRDITPGNGIFKQLQAVGDKLFLMNDKGTVYMRDKMGEWNRIHKGRTDRRFNGMYFVSEMEGYLVGDKGLVISTMDGGGSWKTRRLGSEIILNAVYKKENRLYLGGNEGLILELDNM